jgi:hypothetical protein
LIPGKGPGDPNPRPWFFWTFWPMPASCYSYSVL